MPPLEVVCFDLDGTLCISEQSDAAVHAAVFDRVDIEPYCTPEDVRAVDPADLPTATSDVEFFEHLYRALADARDIDASHAPALAEATVDVVDETAVRFRAGAQSALADARERFDVGLITNGGASTQRTKLEALDIADAFDTVVFCDPANGVEPKPAAEPFRQALSTLDVAPERAVYVGNSLRGDVAGANAVGMRSIWTPCDGEAAVGPEDPTPTRRLDSLAALPATLDGLNPV